jgi:hypothetical protein
MGGKANFLYIYIYISSIIASFNLFYIEKEEECPTMYNCSYDS